MNVQKILAILPLLLWLALMLLLWFTSQASGVVYYSLCGIVAFYLVAVPIGTMKFIEKQSITERFGVQTTRFLILVCLALVSVLATFMATTADWKAFLAVVLSPIPEEVFFRGFILGTFTEGNIAKSSRVIVGSLLLSSLTFSITHIFRPHYVTDFLWSFEFGFIIGFICLLTGSILLPSAIHTVWNFSLATKAEYLSSTQFFLWNALIIAPSCLLFALEWWRKKRSDRIATKLS